LGSTRIEGNILEHLVVAAIFTGVQGPVKLMIPLTGNVVQAK